MSAIAGILNTIYHACLLGIKENPVTGILFTLVMIILASFPGFLLFVFVKSLQRWSNYEYARTSCDPKALKAVFDAERAEDQRGLGGPVTRTLCLVLAGLLLGFACVVQRGVPFLSPLTVIFGLPGAIALALAIKPSLADALQRSKQPEEPAPSMANTRNNNTENPPSKRSIGWGSILLALVLLLAANWEVKVYLRSKSAENNWPAVTGLITKTDVSEIHAGSKGGVPVYKLTVNYEYKVAGGSYRVGPIEVDRDSVYVSEQSAQSAINGLYTKGGPVTVYYNPHDPSQSTMGEAGTGSLMLPAIYFTVAMALIIQAFG